MMIVIYCISQFIDSIYNVPRTMPHDAQLYDTPRGNSVLLNLTSMTADAAIDAGIYNVPRTLMMNPSDEAGVSTTAEDAQYLFGGNPLDIYDYPRVSISPDEEGIYDDPLDIVDMEIYDYPPDASELGVDGSLCFNSSRSSTVTMSGEFAQTEGGNFVVSGEDLKTTAVPPLPTNNARPSVVLSHADDNQVCTYVCHPILCLWWNDSILAFNFALSLGL